MKTGGLRSIKKPVRNLFQGVRQPRFSMEKVQKGQKIRANAPLNAATAEAADTGNRPEQPRRQPRQNRPRLKATQKETLNTK